MLTHQEITQLLSYNEVTGDLRWKIDRTGGVKGGYGRLCKQQRLQNGEIQGELFGA